MICLKCNKKNVCKHYDYFITYDGLHISDCSYKVDTTCIVTSEQKYVEPKVTLLSNEENRDTISSKIQELNKMNISEQELNNNFKVVSTPSELIECENCGTKIYPEDVVLCDSCGNNMCPACGTQSYDCNNEKFINICDICDSLHQIEEDISFNNVVELEDYYGRDTDPNTTPE